MAMVSFFWMIILSIVANNNDPSVDECPLEPVPDVDEVVAFGP